MSTTIHTDSLAVRRLDGDDRPALLRLAERDSTPVPTGELIGAEADGVLVAALSLDGGAVIADPFSPSADAVELLQLRATHLRSERAVRPVRGRLRRVLAGLSRGHAHAGLAGSPPGAGGRLLQL